MGSTPSPSTHISDAEDSREELKLWCAYWYEVFVFAMRLFQKIASVCAREWAKSPMRTRTDWAHQRDTTSAASTTMRIGPGRRGHQLTSTSIGIVQTTAMEAVRFITLQPTLCVCDLNARKAAPTKTKNTTSEASWIMSDMVRYIQRLPSISAPQDIGKIRQRFLSPKTLVNTYWLLPSPHFHVYYEIGHL